MKFEGLRESYGRWFEQLVSDAEGTYVPHLYFFDFRVPSVDENDVVIDASLTATSGVVAEKR
jgi:hypothetical protein